jgi:hypothetical protein
MMLVTSAVVMISTVAGVLAAAVVFTAVEVSGVPAVAEDSAVTAIHTAVDVITSDSVSSVSGGPCCC